MPANPEERSATPDGLKTEAAGPPLPLAGMEATTIPARIGRYRILDLIASGGMGVVYKAEQDQPRRTVALKIPRGGKLLTPEARRRFLEEIGLASNLDHSGIVPVFEASEADGTPYYTMPFIEGWSLRDYVATRSPNLARKVEVVRRAAEIVEALHGGGLIHRDLKPENLMVDRHGDLRLLDFGLARATSSAGPGLTAEHTLLGSLQCMAPEQTVSRREQKLTPAADLYSLGVILYWLACGKWPYSVEGDLTEAVEKIRHEIPPPPSRHNPEVPPELDEVILDCLQKSPSRRPASAGRLAARLRDVPLTDPQENLSPSPDGTSLAPGSRITAGRSAAPSRRRARVPQPNPQARKALRVLGLTSVLTAMAIGIPLLWKANPRRTGAAHGPPIAQPTLNPALQDPRPEETQNFLPLAGNKKPLPGEFRSLYEQANAALRNEVRHQGNGALLLYGAAFTQGPLYWRVAGEATGHAAEWRDGTAILFVPADRPVLLETTTPKGVLRGRISASPGEVVTLDFDKP